MSDLKRRAQCVFLSVFILFFSSAPFARAAHTDPGSVYGPRINKLCMNIVTNADTQVMAAVKGDLDIIGDLARPSDIERLSAGGRLNMSLARGFHIFFMIMNNNTAPWNDRTVRQAVNEAIDKNSIVRTIYSGYCEPVNGWLPPVSPWAMPESVKDVYNREAAIEKLKKSGYTRNIKGILTGPDGKQLKPIKLLTPLARVAPTTAELAGRIADSLSSLGFPVEVEPLDFSALVSRLDRKDYSIALLAWSMGRNPDSLYAFYHSSSDVPGGYNMSGVRDKALDSALDEMRAAKDKTAAERAAVKAQRLLAEIVPTIPVYSRFSVAAVSKSWKNVLATKSVTADNLWTLIAAEPVKGPMRTLNMLLPEEPRNLNPLAANSAYSWYVLGAVYESLMGTDPWTLEDRPSLAESWKVVTKGAGKNAHTELEFIIKSGVLWNDGSRFTARDVKATIDFIKKNKIPRYFDAVKDVRSVSAPSDDRLIVVMNDVSYWHLDRIGGLPCMPAAVIAKIKNWQLWNPLDAKDPYGPFGLVGTGPFVFEHYRPGEYVMMKANPFYRSLGNKKELKGNVWQ